MVVVGEHHPVRRHVYNLCLHCDGAYRGWGVEGEGVLHLWRRIGVCMRVHSESPPTTDTIR